MDVQLADELLDATGIMTIGVSKMIGRERAQLNFDGVASERFAFLRELGFSELELSPTIVRFRKDDLEVDIYHGRQSFEIGFEVVRRGVRYSLAEIIRASDPEVAKRYRHYAATTSDDVLKSLEQLVELVRGYGGPALLGDAAFYLALDVQRRSWAEEYELDVLAGQLRPKAEAAFRHGDYREAAELYERIRPCLSAAELKKLSVAKMRARL